ncbi:N-formylglutamate amidohydrolase [Erythrobacter sp. KY5]|uniref:N-formylglutamate amidohydrolase n=1 Tax=Erythrobacter sp. KY5 TaxID=2011159 RepID=UPI000DBF2467|nr:N-formylglutamate amidohydrolase [Erythrobacter sp. KY5]AWW74912.1 N-formylglutamate amidohydrolase [Erythrobacter sp. KY5]
MIDGQVFEQIGEVKRGGLVCVSDHASSYVPGDLPLGIPDDLLETHIGVDIGVAGVASRMARRHGIPAHMALISRLVIDLHREEDHPKVVPTTSDGHLIPGNIGADVEARLTRYYRPYHDALTKWLDEAEPELIISLHSFTPKLETSDEERPWEVGLLYNEDDRAARHAIRLFGELGLTVGDNEPYSGKELNATMNRHAEAHGRPYCAIEVRQDLISNRADQARWATMIADVCGRVALALD